MSLGGVVLQGPYNILASADVRALAMARLFPFLASFYRYRVMQQWVRWFWISKIINTIEGLHVIVAEYFISVNINLQFQHEVVRGVLNPMPFQLFRNRRQDWFYAQQEMGYR